MNTLIIYLAAIFKNPLRNVAGRERVVNRFIPRIWDKVNLDNGYALYILQENSLISRDGACIYAFTTQSKSTGISV
ncbi:MAG TPA: hypothetical protein ENL19_01625 [candidate division WOR-3 bacterium]|uniref:Uncharacterized protein n=1 Tax=candidate division WOR-3 bacterium TaxID=2052148 RepID=A0A7C5DAT3_UNCW3|nr:hypothetical protein [candidate division WOR-3 bacterium]